jgi:gamma-glutamyltranspeptidase / glutathione hydrolase
LLYGKSVISTNSSIASEHPLASLAGYEALRSGGNAFDAATAVSFALSVLLPQLSGLGGDFFALFEDGKSGKIHCINGSGRTPSGFTIEGMRSLGSPRMPVRGPNSAIVPGCVAGVCEMQERFGVLERSELLESAISLAERGFPVSPTLSRAISDNKEELSSVAKQVFTNRGRALEAGSILKQPRLAKRLQEISDTGPDGFYSGEAAEEIRAAMAMGGLEVNTSDIASYKPEWAEPLGITFREHEVFEIPPNSMGATTLLILKQLEEFDPRDVKPNSQKRIRRMVDAARLAYFARDEQIADPSFVNFDLDKFLKGPRSKRTLRNLAIGDTTYFAISDEEGNLLSCIQSLFHKFGSRVFLEGSGFFLNNRGSAFEFGGPNALAPLKRPIHTLSALLIRRGSSAVAIGCSGGEYRPQQHALLVTNIVDYAMDIEEAIDFPRFLWNGNDTLMVEKGYQIPENPKYRLQLLDYPGTTGVAQGVEVSSESKRAVSDIRGDGLPIGN